MLLLAGCAAPTVLPRAGTVEIPVADGVLRAELALPSGAARGPAVVALHGCGGPFPARDKQWSDLLTAAGHVVLLPDSFGSRGLGSQCREPTRAVTPGGMRRQDAIAAARWLVAQPYAPPGGVVLLGWSNGGSTVLATARAGRSGLPDGLFRGFVAFYPGCRGFLDRPWSPVAPTLLLIGEADDWTPAEPCRRLVASVPGVELVTYPGAFHDFDVPDMPVRLRRGLAYTGDGSGEAHAGTEPVARADALRRVPAYIANLPALR